MNNKIYNILIDYMRETECTCAFKIINTEKGNYKIAVYANRPGLLIGKKGSVLSKYKEMIKKEDKYFDDFDINEVDFILNGFNQKISDADYYSAMDDWFRGHGM